jgi:hypothetical protein
MKGSLKSKAPSRGRDREPSGKQVTNNHYTTPAIIGGNAAGPVKGWEAIQPNTHNKPGYLITAQAAVQEAWLNYLWLIDNRPREFAAQEDAWEQYDTAKRKCTQAYEAYCLGLDSLPIPF